MMKKLMFIAAVVLLPLIAFMIWKKQAEDKPGPNELSQQEIAEGWRLLFDGQTLSNWHTYGGSPVGPAWQAADSALMLYVPERAGNKTAGGGNLVTNEVYSGDFEFKADWKVEKYTNSGIFLFVQEDTLYKEMYDTGLELQVTDNLIYEGADENNNKRAGDLFGVASARKKAVQPVGEWNKLHIIYQGGRLKVFQNDQLIHDHTLDSPAWKEAMANSFLKSAPVAAGKFEGRIGLQDWGSSVWYRNMKIRSL